MRLAGLSILLIFWQCAAAEQLLRFTTLSRGAAEKDLVSEQVVRQAYRSLGIEIEIVPLPGKRALEAANAGQYDGDLRRATVDAERYSNLLKIDVAVNQLEICAYGMVSGPEIRNREDLKHYRVGVQRGGGQSGDLAKTAASHQVVNRIDQLFEMLAAGRIDLAIGNCQIVREHIDAVGAKKLQLHQPPLISKPLYHFLHVRHSQLVPIITSAIRAAREQLF